MDRYDAILEQLKKAQKQGVDSVANRLEAVVENLDDLLQKAKATVQSTLSGEAEQIIPIADIEALVAKARREAGQSGGAPSPSGGVTLENLRTLDEARSQSELLRALLPMLAEHVGRAVVLVIRENVISAWSGIGFENQDSFRAWHGDTTASPNIRQLVDNSTPLEFVPDHDPLFAGWLGGQRPDEAVLLPISLRGKLMGIVYIDHTGDQPWDIEASQGLNAIACWLIDTLQFRTSVPTPTLAKIEVSAVPQAEQPQEEVFEAPAAEEPAEPDPRVDFEISHAPGVASAASEGIDFEPPSKEDQAHIEKPEEKPETVDYDFEPEPASFEAEVPDTDFDPSATVRVDAAQDFAAPAVEAEAPPEPPPPVQEVPAPPSAHEISTPPPVEEVAPPPPVEEVAPPAPVEEIPTPPPVQPIVPPADVSPPAPAMDGELARSPEEEARQEEARRFARLLVSEIKLYNEDEVERGRAEKDIGVRLKDDIERSREMFEKRISEDVRAGHDYFRDELVRILADGDADALGM